MRIHQHPFMGDQANLASYANFDNRIESHFRTQVGLGASIGTGKHGMARNRSWRDGRMGRKTGAIRMRQRQKLSFVGQNQSAGCLINQQP
jgi:hypothetical protein